MVKILPNSARFLNTIVNSLSDMAAYWDNDLRCSFANNAYLEWVGYSKEAMIGMHARDILGSELFALNEPFILAALGGEAQRFERKITKKDGANSYILIQYIPDREGNTIHGFVTLCTDITLEKQAQKDLCMAQTRFEYLMQANVIGVSITDLHGNIFETNDYYLRTIGYTRSEFNAGKVNWKTVTAPQWAYADDAAVCQLRSTGVAPPYEKEYLRRDGSLIPVIIAIALLPGSEQHVITIVQNMTEYKQAQLELRQAYDDLKVRTFQAEDANAAKSQFLSTVSHELRTPLHTMLGYLQLLKRKSNGEMFRQLSLVERSGVSLLRLINDLLLFNTGIDPADEIQRDELELEALKNQIEHFGYLTAKNAGNRFLIKMSPNLPQAVWGDETRLLQILKNLIDNACKFTSNGEVTLCIEHINDENLDCLNKCVLRFGVQDTGVGIPENDLERIFEPLQRATLKKDLPGLGLGLSIARQWVKTLGGDLVVQSTVGKGSEFSFALELPIIESPVAAKPSTSPPNCDAFENKLAKQSLTLLIADDKPENRVYLRYLCEEWGYQVLEATDGQNALDICLSASTPISAIITDQLMPRLNGWDLLKILRESPAPSLSTLPIILISASSAQKPDHFKEDINFDLVLDKSCIERDLACFLCQKLQFIDHAPEFCPANEVNKQILSPPPITADELAHFKELLQLGLVVRIEEWAKQLAEHDVKYQSLSDRVIQYCQEANLGELSMLSKTLTHSCQSE